MPLKNKVQLITYPDSMGGNLDSLAFVLKKHFQGLFHGGIHILPPFPSSGDRGFSPKTYFQIEPAFGDWKQVQELGKEHDILLDVMVNHISAQSQYFIDFVEKGAASPYADMFLPVKKIWPDGKPLQEDVEKIFLRRLLPFSDFTVGPQDEKITLWTTFGRNTPSDQIDIDIHSEVTKKLFIDIIEFFKKNNVNIIRLDAVGYVIKKPGTSCFFISPEIYHFMNWFKGVADEQGIELLPEVHAEYETQCELSENGFWIYDFILPYLILETLFNKNSKKLKEYLHIRPEKQFTMLDCHDGIPVKPDLDGFYQPEEAHRVVDICLERGANLSKVFSAKQKDADGFDVHQICGTYYSMLQSDDDAYFAARAIQFFTPGIPQLYYVGLLAGENDMAAVASTGEGREINRHVYSLGEIEREVKRPIVQKLVRLIDFRNSYPAFDGDYRFDSCSDEELSITWTKDESFASLKIDLQTNTTEISYLDTQTNRIAVFK